MCNCNHQLSGSVQAAQALEAEIIEKGGKAVTYKCDVSDFDKCESLLEILLKNMEESIFL